MRFKYIIAIAVLSLAVNTVQAQMNLPRTKIGGHEYYRYDTSNGESIYDIAAKLGVTKDYIIQNNPDASDGITNGMILYFPVENSGNTASAVHENTVPANVVHVVEQGETLYGLAKKYGVTVDALITANPGSENGIKIGQKLSIPSSDTVSASQQVSNAFSSTTIQPQEVEVVYHQIKEGESI